jgi:hypothetical protein
MQRVDIKQLDALFEAPAQAEKAPVATDTKAASKQKEAKTLPQHRHHRTLRVSRVARHWRPPSA